MLALAKKEKPESELRGAMCDQLDVFLQQETKGFVDKLFVTLETKSYLQSNPEPPSAKPESVIEPATTGVTNGQNIVIPPASIVPVPPPTAAVPVSSATADSRTKKSDRTKRRSWSPRSRSRSRSRDRDRDRPRRSRSRDRSTRDRGGRSTWNDDRRNRNRSPVNRRSDRRRSRSPLPPRRSSRSPRSSRRPRSPAPPQAVLENVPVMVPTDPAVVAVPAVAVAAIQSVVVAPATAVLDRQKFRCRDYDEKGYCMRGDLCPYDHGADPVVLEDVELSSMLNYNRPPPPVGAGAAAPPGPPPVGPPPHLRGPPPSLPPSGNFFILFLHFSFIFINIFCRLGEPYNPDAPGISWPPPPLGGPPGLVGLRPLGPPPPFGHPGHHRPPPHMRMR